MKTDVESNMALSFSVEFVILVQALASLFIEILDKEVGTWNLKVVWSILTL